MDITSPKHSGVDHKIDTGTGTLNSSGSATTMIVGSSGYVALLDVLGFRELVAADRNNVRIIEYLGIVENSLKIPGIESVVFSDSIVLTKHGRDPESLRVVCEACSRLMFNLISLNIPVRGAIACGDYVTSRIDNSTFVAGKPIVEAYDYESRQDWIGVILTASAIRAAQEVDLPSQCDTGFVNDLAFPILSEYLKWKAYLQRCTHVPFHGGTQSVPSFYDGLAIVPGGSTSLEQMARNLQVVLDRLAWLRMVAPTPADQQKYNGTITWLRQIQGTWQSRANEYKAWRTDLERGNGQ
jgi:hypothetical protein